MKADYLLFLSLWGSMALQQCQAFLRSGGTGSSARSITTQCKSGNPHCKAPLWRNPQHLLSSNLRMGQLGATNVTQTVSFQTVAELPFEATPLFSPNRDLWLRRLNTKEDLYWIHKMSSLTSCASSLIIVTAMTSSGLQEFPAWLGPVDATMVVSNLAVCLTTVYMTYKYRRLDDSVARTQLSAGLHLLVMTVYATWESPYCSYFLNTTLGMKMIFGILIVVAAYTDLTTFFNNDIIVTMHDKYRLTKEGKWQALVRGITFDVVLLVPTMMNLIFLFFIMYWDLDRSQWHSAMVHGFGLSFLTGNSMEYIYFANVMLTLGIGLQSFVGTLCHKRLVATDTATAFVGLANVAMLSLLTMCVISPFA